MRIVSPYTGGAGAWLRGNLHTHTTISDGPYDPQKTIEAYAEKGYDFLAITDHDKLSKIDALDPRGMTLIDGNEITADGPHLLHLNAKSLLAPNPDRQPVIDEIGRGGGLAVFCHPNWEADFNHCPQEKLEQYQSYTGIEIFNGVTVWAEGNPCATDRWDRLLSQGRRMWGFANDDPHFEAGIGVGWNVVQSDDRSAQAILDALRQGNFYASTGVAIERIAVNGATIEVQTRDKAVINAFSNHGYRREFVEGTRIAFTVPEDPEYDYVRFECWGFGMQKAWTQPFFITRDA